MGTSLFEQYQREQAKPGSLYAKFLAEGKPDIQPPQDISAQLQAQVNARQAVNGGSPQPTGLGRLQRDVMMAGGSIPGVRAAGAYLGSKVYGIPYKEAFQRLQAQEDQAPAGERIASHLIGALPLAAIPGSPALVGAGVGAADQIANANPDVSLADRAWRAPIGAAVGGAIGKLADVGATRLRSIGKASRDANLVAREEAQTAASKPLYDQALQEGQGLTESDPFINALGRFPRINRLAKGIRANDDVRAIPSGRSPELLDKIYKGLSDEETSLSGRIQNLAQGDRSANLLQQKLSNVQALKGEVLDAIAGPGAPMPSYRPAVQTFAEHQAGIEGVKRGYSTALNASSPAGGGVNQVENTVAGLKRFLTNEQPTPDVRSSIAEGILAKTKERPVLAHLGRFPLPLPAFGGVGNDAALLRLTDAPGQSFVDLLTKLGMLTAGNPARP